MQSIKNVLLNGQPDAYGFNSATWTGPLLIEWVKGEYQVTYKKAQVYNILKKLGLTFQKEKGTYPEAEGREEKVRALKKLQESREDNTVIVFSGRGQLV